MKTLTYQKATDVTALAQQIVAAGIAQTSDSTSTATNVFFGCGSSGSKSAAAPTGESFVYAPDTLSAASEATIDGVVAAYVPPPPVPKPTSVGGGGAAFTNGAQRVLVGSGVAVPTGAGALLSAYVLGSHNGTEVTGAMLLGAFRNDGSGIVQAGTTARMSTGDTSNIVIDFAIGPDGLVYVAVTGIAGDTIAWSVQVAGTVM